MSMLSSCAIAPLKPENSLKRDESLPRHIAIVMDGNGRWAAQRNSPRLMGHQKGVEALKRTISACLDMEIPYLTVSAFSCENWRRPLDEVTGLMTLLRRSIKSELATFHKNNIRLNVIGRRDRLPADLLELLDNARELTKDNTKMTLTIALDYGGRTDIMKAVQELAGQVQAGYLNLEDITEDRFGQTLSTHNLPEPDLFIRTSNTIRMSNFLIWETTYTELFFSSVYWPDFSKEHLLEAIDYFKGCERRFGDIASKAL